MTDKKSIGIVKGLTALFNNPKSDKSKLFEDAPSLRKIKPPFFASDREGSFTALPEAFEDGCYLIYDSASGGTLVLHYSHEAVPENAIGFWSPGPNQTIQHWKYESHGGYSELLRGIVGGTQHNQRYYQGWCQFVQLAKSMKGKVKKVESEGQSLPVDLYGFVNGTVRPISQNFELEDVSDLEAIACVPRHNDRFKGVKHFPAVKFLDDGQREGGSLRLHA